MMKKRIVIFIAVAMLVLAYALPASAADSTGPCNGEKTGREYAEHHISAFAKAGNLGNDGHKPGSHKGFSVCNPSGK